MESQREGKGFVVFGLSIINPFHGGIEASLGYSVYVWLHGKRVALLMLTVAV